MNLNDIFYLKDGVLMWGKKTSRRVSLNSPAGSIQNSGYVSVGLDGKRYYAHRIVWEMHNGKIPDGMFIDHINHIRHDNRIENLRLVSRSENMKNQSLRIDSTSGFTGVTYRKRDSVWIAQADGSHLGSFNSFEEAVKARERYNLINNFHENHGA